MEKFKVTAWPIDDEEKEYNPTWECTFEAESIGSAQSEGIRLFKEQNPDLDHSKYEVHASTP